MKLAIALRLGRVSNLPTVWSNVLAGAALCAAPLSWPTGVTLCVAMSLAYVGGMYLNDAFDREHDARARPERPIPSGQVSMRLVLSLGFAMLALSIALATFVAASWGESQGASSLAAFASASLLALTIVFYDLHHKRNPLSPLVMGLCRVLVYLTVALCLAPWPPTAAVWLGAGALLSYLVGLTYAAKQETLGRIQHAWPLAFLALPAAAALFLPDLASLAFLLGFAGFSAYSLTHLFGGRRNIPRAVGQLIAGIALLDATLVAIAGSPLLAVACVLAWLLTLALQRTIPGT